MLSQYAFKTKVRGEIWRPYLFSENFGRLDVVSFKEFANYIVREMRKKLNVTEESIIQAAAKIINLRSERFQNQISNIQQISKFKILRRLQKE